MKYKILEIGEADAYYGDREEIVGSVVEGKLKRWKDNGYFWGGTEVVSCPTDFFAPGETRTFHAIKVKKIK